MAVARSLSRAELNWRPDPTKWSVGQCLDHLCASNDVYPAAIARALVGKPSGRAEQITPGWFGRWFMRNYIEPSAQTKKGRAPRKVVPRRDVDPSVVDRFLMGNEKLRELIHRAANYDVNRIRFTNPFIPVIHFTVGTGLELHVAHERRHLLQAERITAARSQM